MSGSGLRTLIQRFCIGNKREDIEYNLYVIAIGVGERIKILNWLYAGSTSNRHNDIRKQRKEGIDNWLLKTTRFQQWMQGKARLTLPCFGLTVLRELANRFYGMLHIKLVKKIHEEGYSK
ncbi:hypothetical protein BDD12DRAFT_823918 [Trichophaea hybrida]|nr:hypothetical protein BDD12DRAFT_823918 [Trichophaea hybrida]